MSSSRLVYPERLDPAHFFNRVVYEYSEFGCGGIHTETAPKYSSN